MTPLAANDILRQEELRVQQKFESFGPDATQAICRVFARFGNFRPLLSRVKMDDSGTLEDQQQTLMHCLNRFGAARFLAAVEQGVSPCAIRMDNQGALPDELPATLLLRAALQNPAPEGNGTHVEVRDEIQVETSAALENGMPDRRKQSPGRRQKMTFDYPNDRRKVPCRRAKE